MARPQKPRKVCTRPRCTDFSPQSADGEIVTMAIDEYETIRLIDFEGLSQQECAHRMEVARTTVQAMYARARQKLARCLVQGDRLRIEGGDIRLCKNRTHACGHGCCPMRSSRCTPMNGTVQPIRDQQEEQSMKIAVTYDNGAIFQHFGHTEQFKVYQVTDGQVSATTVLDTNGNGHGALANFLKSFGVDTLICGGIGGGAKVALAEAGIRLYGGVSDDADQAVADLLAGRLAFNPDVACNHHGDHDHSQGGHSCHR